MAQRKPRTADGNMRRGGNSKSKNSLDKHRAGVSTKKLANFYQKYYKFSG
jgi:hypothetical protein